MRVLATGAPFAMAFVAFTLGAVGRNLLSTMSARMAVSALAGVLFFTCTYPMVLNLQPQPVLPDAQEAFLSEAGDDALKMEADHPRVLIFDPQIFLHTGLDMFDPRRVQRYPDHRDPQGTLGLREGDLLVWDANFRATTGVERGIDTLLSNGRFRVIQMKVPKERWMGLGGQPMEVWFMERRDTRYERNTIPLYPLPPDGGAKYVRLDTMQCPVPRSSVLCFAANEFPLDWGRVTD
ncbi:MAG: hypothetical protein IPL52_00030 [Flavobacteriales bacterium]|nr:hypothetical protein [Flavobacteriales bacterium]